MLPPNLFAEPARKRQELRQTAVIPPGKRAGEGNVNTARQLSTALGSVLKAGQRLWGKRGAAPVPPRPASARRRGPGPRAGPTAGAHHHRGDDGQQRVAVGQQPVRRLRAAPQLQLQLHLPSPAARARRGGPRSRHGPGAVRPAPPAPPPARRPRGGGDGGAGREPLAPLQWLRGGKRRLELGGAKASGCGPAPQHASAPAGRALQPPWGSPRPVLVLPRLASRAVCGLDAAE